MEHLEKTGLRDETLLGEPMGKGRGLWKPESQIGQLGGSLGAQGATQTVRWGGQQGAVAQGSSMCVWMGNGDISLVGQDQGG